MRPPLTTLVSSGAGVYMVWRWMVSTVATGDNRRHPPARIGAVEWATGFFSSFNVLNKCFLATSVDVVGPNCFALLAAFCGGRILGIRRQPKSNEEHSYDAYGNLTSPRAVPASTLDAFALRWLLSRRMVQSGRCASASLDRRDAISLPSHIYPYLQDPCCGWRVARRAPAPGAVDVKGSDTNQTYIT